MKISSRYPTTLIARRGPHQLSPLDSPDASARVSVTVAASPTAAIVAASPEAVTDDDLLSCVRAAAEHLATANEAEPAERRCIRAGGAPIWMRVSAAPARGDDGEPLYLVAHVEDVTARREAEEARERSDMVFRALFANSNVGLNIIDSDGPRLRSRRARGCSRRRRPSAGSAAGRRFARRSRLSHRSGGRPRGGDPRDRPEARPALARTLDNEFRIVRPGGEVRWVRERTDAFRGEGSEIRLFGVILGMTAACSGAAAAPAAPDG